MDAAMKLQPNGPLLRYRLALVVDKGFTIEKCLDVFALNNDSQLVPLADLMKLGHFVGLARVATLFILGSINAAGHVFFQGARNTNLNLV